MTSYSLNGEDKALNAAQSVDDMLQQNGYGDMLVAVAINGVFVPRSSYGETMLQAGDTVDIVAPMQGG